MAFKFYHRLSASEFQRYKEFFPKFETESSSSIASGIATTSPQADVLHCPRADNEERGVNGTKNEFHGNRQKGLKVSPALPLSNDMNYDTTLRPSSSTTSLPASSHGSMTRSRSKSRSRRRKTSRPRRSPKKNDPKFKGVTFLLDTAISHGDKEARLTIKSQLSIRRYGRMLANRPMTRWRRVLHQRFCFHGNSQSSQDSLISDSSSTDTDSNISTRRITYKPLSRKRRMIPGLCVGPFRHVKSTAPKVGRHSNRLPPRTIPDPLTANGKTCRSCKTQRTPLWRDADDGTPLCNACGIRYKKYRIRCPFCWLIPRKDSKTFPYCVRCNVLLKMTLQRRIHYL